MGIFGGLNAQLFESTQTNQIVQDSQGESVLDSRAMVTVSYQPYNEFVDNVFYSVGNGLFFTKPFGRFLRASPAGVGFADGDVIDGGNPTYIERPFEGNAVLGLRSFRWSIIRPANQLRISAGSEFFPGKQEVLIGFAVNVGGQDQYGWVRMRRPMITNCSAATRKTSTFFFVNRTASRQKNNPERAALRVGFQVMQDSLNNPR